MPTEAKTPSKAMTATTPPPSLRPGSFQRPALRRHGQSSPVTRISEQLVDRIGSRKFEMWFAHTVLRVDGRRLEVAADSPFTARWIDAHFTDELRGIAREALGSEAEVDVRVGPAPSAPVSKTVAERPTRHDQPDRPVRGVGADDDEAVPAQSRRRRAGDRDRKSSDHAAPTANGSRRRHELTQSPLHSPVCESPVAALTAAAASAPSMPARRPGLAHRLENFVVGESNRLAFAAACRLAGDADADCISPLFIHGECGVGKTHLLQGVCQRFIERSSGAARVRYVTGEQFTNEYIAAIRNNSIDGFRQRVRKLDLLAIDDVHFLSNKVRTQTEFLYTLDAIDLSGARVVLASDNHPHHIKRFSQALVSRFVSGMVVKVDRPDRATRIALIRRLADARGLRLSEPAVEGIASNCVGSVRELEGAITKLAAYRALLNDSPAGSATRERNGVHAGNGAASSNGAGDEVGLLLAEQVFKEHARRSSHMIRLGNVIDGVCERLGVGKSDLMGSSRHRRVVLARGLTAYLSRELTTHSFPEIAQALGRTNHSTIHTADQRLRKQLGRDEMVDLGGNETRVSLRELIERIREDLFQGR